ncbi:MAG: HAMP domain-containing histidine kinase [Patescibacteria group bacterium]|nr:HAMP domain-containing histidine kinase [Patescibacteria group bacterium]
MNTTKNYWKRLGEWATASRRNRFFLARLKLTVFYTLALAIMIASLSITVYRSAMDNVRFDLRDKLVDPVVEHAAFLKFAGDLETDIILIDVIFVALLASLSYIFAGETLRPLQEAMEEQKRFTADVAHELRTPLAIMRADLEIAQDSKEVDKAEVNRLIKSNLEEVEQLTDLAGSLLVLLKEENMGSGESFERLDLRALVERTVNQFQALAEKKEIALEMEEGEPVYVSGNPGSLGIMAKNLVKNALQYTESGGRVSAAVGEENKKAVLRVKDTGVGINEADLPHIFDRFYKADKSRTQTEGGAGLGLSIVNRVVGNHGGQIKINSAAGEGTEVVVSFPLEK